MRTKIVSLKIIVVICLVLLSCINEDDKRVNNGFSIKGKVVGMKSGVVSINQKNYKVKNGTFKLEGELGVPEMFRVIINDGHFVSFFAENSVIDITIYLNEIESDTNQPRIEVSGSDTHEEFERINYLIKSTPEAKRLKELYDYGLTLNRGTKAYKENYMAMVSAREAKRKVQTTFITEYALDNPESVVAAMWMQFQKNEVDQSFKVYEQIVNGFEKTLVSRSTYFKPLKDELESLRNVTIGSVAPDFTLKTNLGEDFTLSSLRNKKVVLVDFWASWCLPCRESFPHLKSVYNKYKDSGFEIVAITNDTNHTAWKKAISEDQTNWIHVADIFPPRGSEVMTAKVITAYSAPYLPSTYLLDQNGIIVAKNLKTEKLSEKLKAIFGF